MPEEKSSGSVAELKLFGTIGEPQSKIGCTHKGMLRASCPYSVHCKPYRTASAPEGSGDVNGENPLIQVQHSRYQR